jgi:hypothetical protein
VTTEKAEGYGILGSWIRARIPLGCGKDAIQVKRIQGTVPGHDSDGS